MAMSRRDGKVFRLEGKEYKAILKTAWWTPTLCKTLISREYIHVIDAFVNLRIHKGFKVYPKGDSSMDGDNNQLVV